jgi:predicted small metal-binding protein
MRVLDCDCGTTLHAANDDELLQQVRQHVDEAHPEMELSDDAARDLIAQQAYNATDS